MRQLNRVLFLLAAAGLCLPVQAADMVKRKSGLWEIKTTSDGRPGMTMQVCIDEKMDDMTTQQARDMEKGARQQCPKLETKKVGDRMVIDSVCKFDKFTATGHTEISGQMSTQYRMESTTRYDPPMHGMAKSHTVMDGRWLGPCKPGQGHGAVSISGMPGGGSMNIDPEMLKALQKRQ